MATISRLTVDLIANSARFRKDLDKAAKDAKKSFGSIIKSAKAATAAFVAVGAALGGVLLSSAKTYGDFTEALQDVKAKTGATTLELNAMASSMRKVAKETKFTATQTAEAGTFLAQAGLSIVEINAALRPTLNLAAASRTGVQETANYMTNIMKGMNLQNDQLIRASDVLAKTTASSNTNLTDLAQAMSYAAPFAVEFGMSIEDTSAMLGQMANAGIKGSRAGTALRGAFTQLTRGGELTEVAIANSTGEMTKQAVALRNLGVATRNSAGDMRPLLDIVEDIQKAGGTADDMVKIFGSIASGKMLNFLRGGTEAIRELTVELEKSKGAAKSMSEIQMDQLNGDVLILNSQLSDMKIEIASNGLNDMLRKATQGATSLLKAMEPALVATAKYADELAIALATVGGVVVLLGLGKLIVGMKLLAVTIAANPLFLLVGLATAVFAGLAILVYNNLDKITFYTQQATSNIHVYFANMLGLIKTGFSNLETNIILFYSNIVVGVATMLLAVRDRVVVQFNNLIYLVNKVPKVNIDLIENDQNSKLDRFVKGLKQVNSALRAGKEVFDMAALSNDVYMSANDHLAVGVAHLNSEMLKGTITAKQYTEAFNVLASTLGTDGVTSSLTSVLPETGEENGEDGKKLEAATAYDLALTAEKEHLQKMFAAKRDWKAATVALQQASDGEILTMGAKHSKKLLMLEKVMALKTIAIQTAKGISKAFSEHTFPMNLAMAAKAAAVGAIQLSAVRGQFHDGIDNVPNTGTYLLESGERVVDKRLNKDMSQFLADQNSSGGNTTNNSPTLNFNVSGGNADEVEQMLMNHRGKFEGMIRDIYSESAQNSPF